MATLLVACPQPPSSQATPEHESRPDVVAHAPAASTDAQPARVEPGAVTPRGDAAVAPRPAPRAQGLGLERVASTGRASTFAIGAGGALYRINGDRWARVPIGGAEARDVVASRGVLYVLAAGTGENRGTAIVMRSDPTGQLTTVAAPTLGPNSDPRALGVEGPREFYIGGENPPLVRLLIPDQLPVQLAETRVVGLRMLASEVVVSLHGGGRMTITRWGESSTATIDDFVDLSTEPGGRGTLIRGRGIFERGRPGRLQGAITTESPFAPLAAAMLLDGRPAVAGANGAFAVWQGNAWRTVQGRFPADPVAIVAADPPLVVGRAGMVTALAGSEAQVVVEPPR